MSAPALGLPPVNDARLADRLRRFGEIVDRLRRDDRLYWIYKANQPSSTARE
jgi:hypothetical protein